MHDVEAYTKPLESRIINLLGRITTERPETMKVNLRGLLNQAGAAAKAGDKTYGAMYAGSLDDLYQHIVATVNGDHTLEEFADFYCIQKTENQTPPRNRLNYDNYVERG